MQVAQLFKLFEGEQSCLYCTIGSKFFSDVMLDQILNMPQKHFHHFRKMDWHLFPRDEPADQKSRPG